MHATGHHPTAAPSECSGDRDICSIEGISLPRSTSPSARVSRFTSVVSIGHDNNPEDPAKSHPSVPTCIDTFVASNTEVSLRSRQSGEEAEPTPPVQLPREQVATEVTQGTVVLSLPQSDTTRKSTQADRTPSKLDTVDKGEDMSSSSASIHNDKHASASSRKRQKLDEQGRSASHGEVEELNGEAKEREDGQLVSGDSQEESQSQDDEFMDTLTHLMQESSFNNGTRKTGKIAQPTFGLTSRSRDIHP
ncbi:MAG: hypothetical protein M1816_003326 [Peltula sp. TS41687]|nr:MAG: hypothetical protein M1816_003326 [Peltula sp. TS41687]